MRFPASDALKAALTALKERRVNLVQMSLDIAKETIELASSSTVGGVAELPGTLTGNDPRFSVFRWDHEHDDAPLSSHVVCRRGACVRAARSNGRSSLFIRARKARQSRRRCFTQP